MAKDSSFRPGGAKFGNFIDYYRFNPAQKRIEFIPEQLIAKTSCFSKCLALDVGCNTGELTKALYAHLSGIPQENSEVSCTDSDEKGTTTASTSPNAQNPIQDLLQNATSSLHVQGSLGSSRSCDNNLITANGNGNIRAEIDLKILGVDIDATLIERANEANQLPDNVIFCALDIMDRTQSSNYIQTFLETNQKERFDFTFCFSVTMWIHLNNGDDGLRTFLQRICQNTQYLIIEPQPWKCYKSAMRRLRQLKCPEFQTFSELNMRETVGDDIVSYLESDCNMVLVDQLGVTDWDRKLLLLKNKDLF